MNKKLTVISVAVIALMLAGIAWAVARLYSDDKPKQAATRTEYPLLRAVPADAAAVFCFDGSSKARRILADSTGVLRSFLAPDSPALMDYLARAGEHRMLVSLHNSGSLVPLVAMELKQFDSTALAPYAALAEKAGLKTTVQDGLLLASRSETLLNSSCRHLDEGICILEAPGLPELTARTGGSAVVFLSSRQVPKILQVWSTARVRKQTDFIRTLADWTAFEITEADDRHIVLKGSAESPEKTTGFLSAFAGFSTPAASFAEVLPYYTDYAVSLPLGSIDAYLEHYRHFKDAKGKLQAYDKALKSKSGREMTPEQWAQHFQVKEAVRAAYQLDGIRQDVLLVKTGRDIPAGTNAYPGCLAVLLGDIFQVTDTLCVPLPGHWTVMGTAASAGPFMDRKFLDYPLKDRLADAGLSLPAGFVAYASVTDAPSVLTDLFAKEPAAALGAYVTGSAYAPALAGIDLGAGKPDIRISLDKRALKGNKVQVLERDTTVVVPAGPFPVLNSSTGKTNSFYQNKQLSLCLNDENGKGVWGVPFKQPLCGYVESIDYYANGKVQFLFAAGQSLFLIDRLGRFVGGFPVDLGKPVLLGPQAYDFTGAKGYTVMVLHKDNSLEMYNLHGQKASGWKGIRAPETVKALPELLEVKGRKYWVVRTSIRTLVYGFEGGEPLTKDEGGKMIRPDSEVSPSSRGITVECYDGKTRDIKLQN
ncbi:MAG: hypothetical protein IJ156_07380 [Bacteroidales bacterium]|nr:hypothetical protein [Bacteroidales bacterium]